MFLYHPFISLSSFLVPEVAAVPLPPPSLSQMPYTLDISSSQSQAETTLTRASTPPHNVLTSKESAYQTFEEPKRNPETGGCGDTDLFLPSVCVPNSLQTLKPHSNAVISNTSTTTTTVSNSNTSHSIVEVVSKTSISSDRSYSVGDANCLSGGAESAISRSSVDVSILAPSSLTLSGHNTSCNVGKGHARRKPSTGSSSGLPSHGLMGELFRGKQSKQGVSSPSLSSATNELEEEARPAKRQCLESGSRTDLPHAVDHQGDLFGGMVSRGTRKKVVSAKQLEQIAPMEVEKVMSIGCTDRDEVENKLIVSSIPRSTICLDPIHNKNNGVCSIFGGKHISDTRKAYDYVRKTVQEAGSIPSGDHSPENKISLDPVSNMPQCVTGSTPKRINIGITKPVNSGTKPNGDGTVITPDAVGTRIDEPVTKNSTKENFVVLTSFLSSRKVKRLQQQPSLSLDASQISVCGSQSATISSAVDTSSSGPFTALSLGQLREVVPLTAVSTGGKRSKVMPSHASLDVLWVEDHDLGTRKEGESVVNDWVEDPLGSLHDGGEGFSCKRFQSVCDADGFIKTRVPPRLQVSARYCIVC